MTDNPKDFSRNQEALMLIENYDLELFVPPCEPGSETWSAIARLTVDISRSCPI